MWGSKKSTGFKKTQKGLWLLSMAVSLTFNWMFILEKANDARSSRDNDDVRKVLWYVKQDSPFPEDNSSVVSIATSVIANEVEKLEEKDVFKYILKHSHMVELYLRKHPVKLLPRLVALVGSFNISFNDCKGHEMWVHLQVLLESII